MIVGSGFIGTDKIEFSVAGQNIIPDPPANWTVGYKLYKFSFLNKDACHVIINDGNSIFLDENQGFDSDEKDARIEKFVIVENNIRYQFIGAY